jgi:hypothetical protein
MSDTVTRLGFLCNPLVTSLLYSTSFTLHIVTPYNGHMEDTSMWYVEPDEPRDSHTNTVPLIACLPVVGLNIPITITAPWQSGQAMREAQALNCCERQCTHLFSLNQILGFRSNFHLKERHDKREWLVAYLSALTRNGKRHYQLGGQVPFVVFLFFFFLMLMPSLAACLFNSVLCVVGYFQGASLLPPKRHSSSDCNNKIQKQLFLVHTLRGRVWSV